MEKVKEKKIVEFYEGKNPSKGIFKKKINMEKYWT